MIEFSIIISCYNSEDTITSTLNSIANLNYDFSKIEIIIINDGSTDKTLILIKQFIEENPKIQVFIINQKNKGLSFSRNLGILNSNKSHLLFLDSDDQLNNEILSKINDTIKDNDIVAFSRETVFNGNITYEKNKNNNLVEFLNNPKDLIVGAQYYCYKKTFLLNNNIFFKEQIIHEDILFLVNIFSVLDKIKVIEYFGYRRFIIKDSLSQRNNYKRFKSLLIISNEIYSKLNFISTDRKYFFEYFGILSFINGIYSLITDDNFKMTKEIKYLISSNKWLSDSSVRKSLKRKIQFFLIRNYNLNLIKFLFSFYEKIRLPKI
tara:strand:+ start:1026 stop:1988 length:963 start_codon:yes stop_codon:yes gene_type:complete